MWIIVWNRSKRIKCTLKYRDFRRRFQSPVVWKGLSSMLLLYQCRLLALHSLVLKNCLPWLLWRTRSTPFCTGWMHWNKAQLSQLKSDVTVSQDSMVQHICKEMKRKWMPQFKKVTSDSTNSLKRWKTMLKLQAGSFPRWSRPTSSSSHQV